MPVESDETLEALLERSHRLGADRRITNFAGGNTSAKTILTDPVTGEPTRVLLVKGSGGDLGTLTADGLAALDLDRVRALERLRDEGAHEDDSRRVLRRMPLRYRWRAPVDRHSTPRVRSTPTTSTTPIPTR